MNLIVTEHKFQVKQWVTWRKNDESSWIEYLRGKFGNGPFVVTQLGFGSYESTKVSLTNPFTKEQLTYHDGQTMFNESWLEPC